MKAELVAYTPNPEETIEKAARICYNSQCGDYEKRKKFLSGLIKSGHTSTIEHASATFKFSMISRACSHELVRHRLSSFSQASQRYINATEVPCQIKQLDGTVENGKTNIVLFSNVCPQTIIDAQFGNEWIDFIAQCGRFYNKLIEAGIPKEDARYVLPNACCTELYMSANFREWRHFLELRLSPRAQWEIRQLAHLVLNELYKVAPIIFQDLKDKYDGPESAE